MKTPGIFLALLIWAAGVTTTALGQSPTFSNTIWAGTLTGKTKEVAHYQGNVKGASVTGATANQVPVEIWFPSETNFCVVFNNRTARASAAQGDHGA